MTIQEFASLVHKLRAVQKADGSGYRNQTSRNAAQPLEIEVDTAVKMILHRPPAPPPKRPPES